MENGFAETLENEVTTLVRHVKVVLYRSWVRYGYQLLHVKEYYHMLRDHCTVSRIQ